MVDESALSPDPQRREHATQRIELTPCVTITLNLDAAGICVIDLEGPLSQDIALKVRQAVQTHCTQAQQCGLLVDVRRSSSLSLVQLASLLDILSEFGVPVAVVLHSENQRQLAGLLHNTLAHTDAVAYFTAFDAALDYVRTAALPPTDSMQ